MSKITEYPSESSPEGDDIVLIVKDPAGAKTNATSTLTAIGTAIGATVGPASAADNGIVRFDGITGKQVQDSGAVLNDDATITLTDPENITYDETPDRAALILRHTRNGSDYSSYRIAQNSYDILQIERAGDTTGDGDDWSIIDMISPNAGGTTDNAEVTYTATTRRLADGSVQYGVDWYNNDYRQDKNIGVRQQIKGTTPRAFRWDYHDKTTSGGAYLLAEIYATSGNSYVVSVNSEQSGATPEVGDWIYDNAGVIFDQDTRVTEINIGFNNVTPNAALTTFRLNKPLLSTASPGVGRGSNIKESMRITPERVLLVRKFIATDSGNVAEFGGDALVEGVLTVEELTTVLNNLRYTDNGVGRGDLGFSTYNNGSDPWGGALEFYNSASASNKGYITLFIGNATNNALLRVVGHDGDNAYDQLPLTLSQTGVLTVSDSVVVPDETYNATSWNGNNEVPTKNAIRDKIESLASGYSPKIYVYLPDYKPQTEIDDFVTDEITPNGKIWGVWWENFRFNSDGSTLFVDTTVSGGSNMGFSSGNKTKVQSIADNILVNMSGDVSGATGAGAMLADSGLRADAITDIVAHVVAEGFQGVSINFEPIADLTGTVLTNFRTFITALRAALDAEDPALLLAWAGQITWDSDQPNKEYSSVNYTGESNMAGTNNFSVTLNDYEDMGFDIIEMQAYDQFYDFGFSEFGITSPDQVVNAINFAHSRIPRSKYGLIIGTYGVRTNSGADEYGENVEGNNLSRSEITALDATFYSTATRQNNKYLLKTIDTSVGTATMTIASPGVISRTAHGLAIGETISFTTTGALPTGIVAGTTYYVISAGFGANSFRISADDAGAVINTTGTQSGTHTLYRRTSIQAPDQSTVDTYYNICKNREVEYIGFWLCGDYYFPSTR